jgi:hypothetical protein
MLQNYFWEKILLRFMDLQLIRILLFSTENFFINFFCTKKLGTGFLAIRSTFTCRYACLFEVKIRSLPNSKSKT